MSIIEDGGSGVTMELEMQWDGNPSIILDIKTLVGVSLPVQVLLNFPTVDTLSYFLLFGGCLQVGRMLLLLIEVMA